MVSYRQMDRLSTETPVLQWSAADCKQRANCTVLFLAKSSTSLHAAPAAASAMDLTR